MRDGEALVFKLAAVDRFAAAAGARLEVAALGHEAWDDSVEDGALVVQRQAAVSNALFARAEGAKVLGGLWHTACERREG